MPIFAEHLGYCGTTRFFLEEMLPIVGDGIALEVETYSFNVLPPELRSEIRGGVRDPRAALGASSSADATDRRAGRRGPDPGPDGPPHPAPGGLRGKEGADIEAVTPAVTCTAQSTYLTGSLPREHGIVANGWYFRDLNEVWLWRQSNRLVQGEKIWQVGRRRDPNFTCANSFWWYAMATEADVTLTPRPLYCADGLKLPDFYSDPPELREELKRELGEPGPGSAAECRPG